MPQRQREIVELLRFELEFLERGGYSRSPSAPWKAQSMFVDSLTCPNFNHRARGASLARKPAQGTEPGPRPCSDCELFQFVPAAATDERVPCHHIPLNAVGQTVATLDRGNNDEELQEAVIEWLQDTIARLERERNLRRAAGRRART